LVRSEVDWLAEEVVAAEAVEAAVEVGVGAAVAVAVEEEGAAVVM